MTITGLKSRYLALLANHMFPLKSVLGEIERRVAQTALQTIPLDHDTRNKILSYLPFSDQLALSHTCKGWRICVVQEQAFIQDVQLKEVRSLLETHLSLPKYENVLNSCIKIISNLNNGFFR